MAKIAEFNATLLVDNTAVTLFYDDSEGLSGGWGINDGASDWYRPFDELVDLIEVHDRIALIDWIEIRTVERFKGRAADPGGPATAREVRTIVNDSANWIRYLQIATLQVPPTPTEPEPAPMSDPGPGPPEP